MTREEIEEEIKALHYVKDYYDSFGNLCAHTDRVLESKTKVEAIIGKDKKTIKIINDRLSELGDLL